MGINPRPVPLAFGPWQPDAAPHQSNSLTECINVLPIAGAYAPFPSFDPVSGVVLPSDGKGLFSQPLSDGTPIVYAATADHIYRVNQGSLDTPYSNPGLAAASWQFTSFDDRVIAINPNANPQGAAPGGMFIDLGGSPPRAHVAAVVGENFLVLGNLVNDGIDGTRPNRIRWCGFNNPDTWGTDIATQADFDERPFEGGPVMAITGRETGTVFQRKALSRMSLTGQPVPFNFTTVEEGRGPIATGAVCDIGNLVFLIADDGFFVWDGTTLSPIGDGYVNGWFNDNLDHSAADTIVSAYDPVTRCVLWGFPEFGKTSPSKIMLFSMVDKRFSLIDQPVQQIAPAQTLPVSLEDMPIPDTYPGSFDDVQFRGGLAVMAVIDNQRRYGVFGGTPMPATLTTGDYQSQTGQRAFVNSVRPICDASGARISIGARNEDDANAIIWSAPSSRGVDGACPQRVDARLTRHRLTTLAAESWKRASGLEINMRATGRR